MSVANALNRRSSRDLVTGGCWLLRVLTDHKVAVADLMSQFNIRHNAMRWRSSVMNAIPEKHTSI